MSKLITKQYEHEGKSIDVLFTETAFFNATMQRRCLVKSLMRGCDQKTAKEYLDALREKHGLEQNQLVRTVNGGIAPGTWLHPKLAVPYARWLSVRICHLVR